MSINIVHARRLAPPTFFRRFFSRFLSFLRRLAPLASESELLSLLSLSRRRSVVAWRFWSVRCKITPHPKFPWMEAPPQSVAGWEPNPLLLLFFLSFFLSFASFSWPVHSPQSVMTTCVCRAKQQKMEWNHRAKKR